MNKLAIEHHNLFSSMPYSRTCCHFITQGAIRLRYTDFCCVEGINKKFIWYNLKDLHIKTCLKSKGRIFAGKEDQIKFETVLNSVPKRIQKELLFHLDLFA